MPKHKRKRAGRPRKSGPRYESGRLVQPTKSEREANVKNVVLMQPHRKGDESQMRENAIGRMILDCWDKDWWPDKQDQPQWSRQDLYTAAMAYSDAWASVQGYMASGRPLANSTRTGGVDARTDEELADDRAKAERRWSDMAKAIGSHESIYRKAADHVIIDNPSAEWVAPFWVKHGVKMALVNLAAHCLAGKRRAA